MLGYVKARDLISYRYDATPKDREAKPGILERPEWRDRLKIRTLDLKKLGDEAAIIVDIFNDAWSENWGFVPFTLEEFMSSADGLKLIMPPEGGFMIELDGAPQAFGIVLPNLNEITADLDGRLLPFGLPRLVSRIRNHQFQAGRLVPVRRPPRPASQGGRRRGHPGLHRGGSQAQHEDLDHPCRIRLGAGEQHGHAAPDRTRRRQNRQDSSHLRKKARMNKPRRLAGLVFRSGA